jgi:NAD(P)-dependent dehydrogenase (short-subunit alcohol dehydrogenase family)
MTGKTCMVTGASQGIGKATALGLARLGARVVLVCRDRGRGEAAQAAIRQAVPGAEVELMLADLSDQKQIRQLAQDFKAKHDRLHVLVNNAGAIIMERRLTVDGLEATFATNHLGYFLLTTLLLDVLKASAPARVVNVSSAAHRRGKLDFDDLQHERSYSFMRVYSDSKLANIYFTRELARRLAGTGVTANCLHPGVIGSNFGQSDATWFKIMMKLGKPFLGSEASGAATSIYLASSPEVEGVTGKYFVKSKERHPARVAQDDAVARRLWDVSEKLTAA